MWGCCYRPGIATTRRLQLRVFLSRCREVTKLRTFDNASQTPGTKSAVRRRSPRILSPGTDRFHRAALPPKFETRNDLLPVSVDPAIEIASDAVITPFEWYNAGRIPSQLILFGVSRMERRLAELMLEPGRSSREEKRVQCVRYKSCAKERSICVWVRDSRRVKVSSLLRLSCMQIIFVAGAVGSVEGGENKRG